VVDKSIMNVGIKTGIVYTISMAILASSKRDVSFKLCKPNNVSF